MNILEHTYKPSTWEQSKEHQELKGIHNYTVGWRPARTMWGFVSKILLKSLNWKYFQGFKINVNFQRARSAGINVFPFSQGTGFWPVVDKEHSSRAKSPADTGSQHSLYLELCNRGKQGARPRAFITGQRHVRHVRLPHTRLSLPSKLNYFNFPSKTGPSH